MGTGREDNVAVNKVEIILAPRVLQEELKVKG